MSNLKEKTINSAKWSLLEKVINLGFEFAVSIILARLLMPSDFGTVAIISVVISFTLIFVNSGFSQSLVRDPQINDKDYSTIFFFNLTLGIIFYILLYTLSPKIANFYNKPELIFYIKILGLSILISSFTLIQSVSLTIDLNFKLMSKISIASSITSGTLALGLAYSGFGIWSLIIKTLSREVIQTCLFWINNKWMPKLLFDLDILKKHFKYGSNFLLSAIIGQVYNNILALTIGKIYNLQTLGYYNRAQLFSNIITESIGGVMTSVSFPALAKVQENKDKFVNGVNLLLKQAVYVIGILMIMVFFSSKKFIPLLLGEQWADAGVYLQYLCIIGFFAVLNSILVNSISVTGRSIIYLLFQIWAMFCRIIGIIFGFYFGINSMLLFLIGTVILSYTLISLVFQYFYQYSLLNQLYNYKSIFIILVTMIITGIIFTLYFNTLIGVFYMLISQVILVLLISNYLKIEEFLLIKKIILKKKYQ